VRKLDRANIKAMAIHGDKSQGARTKALEGFRSGSVPILVASDIAARGLDIDEIRLVVNYDVPADPDTYVHRIGRTGRAGASGKAVTFITSEDHEEVRDIEKRIGRPVPRQDANGRAMEAPKFVEGANKPAKAPRQRNRQGKSESKGQTGSRDQSGGNKPATREDRNRQEGGRPSQGGQASGRGERNRNAQGGSGRDEQRSGRNQGQGGSSQGNDGNRRGRNRGPRSGERRDERPSGSGSSSQQPAAPKNLFGKLWNKLTGGEKR